MERLFEGSLNLFKQEKLRDAAAKANALSDSQLLNPSLAGRLDAIAGEFRFVVAKLRPEERRGKRRTETKEVNDYGQRQTVQMTVIDVAIPFDGYPKSLTIAPSRSHIIQTLVSTIQNPLVVPFMDDENLDKNVDDFIKRVSENLDSLRSEVEGFSREIRAEIQAIVDRRLTILKAQKEQDAKRSFPIE